ncbi:DNA-binding transcriptional regulator, MerR family [Sphingomonas gellani]|uniref:DNA-binding transcriptional regulator, MerR family n=1 Tax=Sphingomonas gellani TaxID=1166340 RepID=A0A1H8G7I1_9SPHN|nr:MerR family DNA-binding transcriptional regulator [Sphingomonas gellani]SEN39996.1 DNA-binding transcriptional regulator, MerR family [Sphingomonas gellani]
MEHAENDLKGIQEVADGLGVTPRTLRFYEDRGLIEPQRVGTQRIYTRRETARMQLILRGKRLGFTLREIQEFLDLYEADAQHVGQMKALASRCRERIDDLEAKLTALTQTLNELKLIEDQALSRIPEA